MAVFRAVFFCTVVFIVLGKTSSQYGEVVINTTIGMVLGERRLLNGIRLHVFKGIPYAEPPTGPRRFSAPVAKTYREGAVYNATVFGPSCPQDLSGIPRFYPKHIVRIPDEARVLSEDCLTLNIYAPVNRSAAVETEPAAVIFFVHGGSYLTGQGSGYDGAGLAAHSEVVVVTINYRLNVFGFLSTGDSHAPGNFGLLDQQLALRWVNENIAAFGGDSARVTILGQSAGGDAVGLHLFANESRPLFKRIAIHSGPVPTMAILQPVGDIYQIALTIGEVVGCAGLSAPDTASLIECLRSRPMEDILAAGISTASEISPLPMVFIPVLDGTFVSSSVGHRELLHELLVIHTSGDGSVVVEVAQDLFGDEFNATKGLTQEQADQLFIIFQTSDVAQTAINWEYMDQQAKDRDFDRLKALTEIMLDWNYIARISTSIKDLPGIRSTHSGIFDHRSSSNDKYPRLNLVSHGEELSYVFGLPFTLRDVFTEEERALSSKVIAYWSNFAKSGDPNNGTEGGATPASSLTYWPEYGTSEKFLLIRLHNSTVGEGYRRDKVEFWTEYLPKLTTTAEESCPVINTDNPSWSSDNPSWSLDAPSAACENVLFGEGFGFTLTTTQAETLVEIFIFLVIALLIVIVLFVGAICGYKYREKVKVGGLSKSNGSVHKQSVFEVNEGFYSESEDTPM